MGGLKLKGWMIPSAGEDVEQLELLCTADVSVISLMVTS